MKKKKVTLKTVKDLGNKIRKGKPFVGECIDRFSGKIMDLSGKTIKRIGKKK